MRAPLVFLACASFAAAQSHPVWWTYSSPQATAIVGVEWHTVRGSPFADPVEAELWGDLGFPDLACLRGARQFLISSPELLALASGSFPLAAIRAQSAKKGMREMLYRGVEMWFASGKDTLSIARLNDQLVMLGNPATLQAAVDRTMTDSRSYSPLLARASKFSQRDLWVVASQLPDDLASRFVPLDLAAQGFEGSVSVRSGLDIEATLAAGSPQQARASADKLQQAIPEFPLIARGVQVSVEEDSIKLGLTADFEQVAAALRGPDPVVKPAETIRMESPKHIEQVPVETPLISEKVIEKAVETAPQKPQIIRIVGLDDGPREILLPATKPEKPKN